MRLLFYILAVLTAQLTLTSCPADKEVEPRLEVSPGQLTLDANGEGELFISSNTVWNVSSTESWLSFSTMSGKGDGQVTVRAMASTSERKGTVTVKAGGLSRRTMVERLATDNTAVGVVAMDLGLPSGTLWANVNVGATKPEDYGDYFAWGETETKDFYDSSTYKYYVNGSYVNIGSDIAGTQYDAATVNWGAPWKMPTVDQIEELLDNTTSTWTTLNGVDGRKFTSKINGNSIFLPAAGDRWFGKLEYVGSLYYWSSTLYESGPNSAYYLHFSTGDVSTGDVTWGFDGSRTPGHTVRPVR